MSVRGRVAGPGLSTTSAAALVVGNMIGMGVFVSAGFSLVDLGRGTILVAWVIGGGLALCGALAYGALAMRYPRSGGEYEFVSQTLHPTLGFVTGIVSLLAGFSAPIAVAAVTMGAYLGPVLNGAFAADARWIGTATILVAGGLHLGGLRLGARVQDLAVGIKLLAIVALLVGGAVVLLGRDPELSRAVSAADAAKPFRPAAFAVTLYFVALSYSGWNAAVYIAGEVADARRRVPRALLIGTLLVTALYLGLNAVFLWSADDARLAGQPQIARLAADALFGRWAADAVSLMVGLALFTSISAMVMAGPRVYARMAEAGVFPRIFAGGGHRPAVLLQVAVALVMLWRSGLRANMEYIGFTLSLSSALAVVGLLVQRGREGRAAVPIPGGIAPAWIYVLAVIAIAAAAFPESWEPAIWSLGSLLAAGLLHQFVIAPRGGGTSRRAVGD